MTDVAADVPGRYDLVLDDGGGHVTGFVTAKDDQSGLYYRPRRAAYTQTPTFVERSNVQGNYGDNQQDFWLTFSQNDWSLGEQQRYFRATDNDSIRRYWSGTNIDVVGTPGAVAMQAALTSFASAAGASTTSTFTRGTGAGAPIVVIADDTNNYNVTASGFEQAAGAHGLGAVPTDMCADDSIFGSMYLASAAKIRKSLLGSGSWSTFSTSGAYNIAFLNNTLYGLNDGNNLALFRWDTAGVRSEVFRWKRADGTSIGFDPTAFLHGSRTIVPYGGKLAVLLVGQVFGYDSLWVYDGTAPAVVAQFPPSFLALDVCQVNGVLYVSGVFSVGRGTLSGKFTSAVYYYANGTFGILWQQVPNVYQTGGIASGPRLAPYRDGLLITDTLASGNVYYYNTVRGGVSCVASPGTSRATTRITGASSFCLLSDNAHTGFSLFPTSGTATTATISTSLFDGESSLDKYFKAVKVDWDAATDGDGGSVDIAYQLNTVDGSYTSVQSSAVAGTEYTIGQTGRSISIKVTLNKGTSTLGPVLKRVSVRAAPKLPAFKRREYVLELAGRDGQDMVQLRDGTSHAKDGMQMAQDLLNYYIGVMPVTVTDRFGTFTGYVEPDASQIIEVKPEVFFAHLTVRQI